MMLSSRDTRSLMVVISVIAGLKFARPVLATAFDEVSSLHVWITVSSLAHRDPANSKSILFRQIELNWINAPLDDHDDFIGLYLDEQPDEQGAQPVSLHRLNARMNGKLATDHYLPMIDFMNETRLLARPQEAEVRYEIEGPSQFSAGGEFGAHNNNNNNNNNWHQHNTYGSRHNRQRHKKSATRVALNEECVGYCVAYHSQSRVLATNCLKTNPNWMQDTQSTSRSLTSLMIPGTHNSATYPRQLDRTVLQMINKYQINQEESIFNQLVYGIRYLDLRVGHSKVRQRPEELWVYHDIFRTDVSLSEVFEQVGRFLDLTTHEIIVMDFHRFTVGFQNENAQVQRERHAKLVDMLFKQLGRYIIPSYLGQHAPLNEYISMGKRLIVGYASRAQLLGAQADSYPSMFGLYSAQASNKNSQQVRDIDADEAPHRQSLETNSTSSNDHDHDDELQDNPQTDRRMGTRIYNKLKSLKMISRQFSKRSIENDADDEKKPQTGGASKHTKQRLRPNGARQANQMRPLPPPSLPPAPAGAATATSEPMSAQLVDLNEDAVSTDEAVANLAARLALLFPPVRHLWPNKDTVEGLAQYMNETTCRKYFGELRAMMVELTPTVFGAISDKYDGNRRLADSANRPVTDWIRQRWLHCLNIVASDFFLGNDLIRLSIHANRMRLSNNNRLGPVDDLSAPTGQCKSFRRIGHLLDKTRIAASVNLHQQNQPAAGGNQHQPEGTSEFFSFFKRMFNL